MEKAPAHDKAAVGCLAAQCPALCVAFLATSEHMLPTASHSETGGNSSSHIERLVSQ